MDRVMIGTVAVGQPEWAYVKSVFGLETPGEKMLNIIDGKRGIDEGHNKLCQDFMDTGYEWLLSVDSDAALHPKSLTRMLSWGEPFVCGLATMRRPHFPPVVFNEQSENGLWKRDIEPIYAWAHEHPEILVMGAPTVLQPRPDDALMRYERGGAHCLLTHRSVIEAIGYPWYARTTQGGTGSDFFFTERAIECGFTPYLDRSVMTGHVVHGHVATLVDALIWNSCVNLETGVVEIPFTGV